jgi:hypothetical protein
MHNVENYLQWLLCFRLQFLDPLHQSLQVSSKCNSTEIRKQLNPNCGRVLMTRLNTAVFKLSSSGFTHSIMK